MSAHRVLRDLFRAFEANGPGLLNDPGSAGTITFTMYGQQCLVTTAAAEARTLARPTKAGILASVVLDTDGGDLTLTVTGGYNADADTSITFGDAGDMVTFLSVKTGTTFQWTAIAQEGTNIAVETGEFDALVAGAITGGDNSLGITGEVQATTVDGGTVVIAGAASIAGATGAGGAVSVTGGASGSTNDDGGAVTADGGVGTGTGAGGRIAVTGGAAPGTGDGGQVLLTGGATTGGASGTGGAATIAGGANGNTTNGAGGAASVTGGAGKGTGDGGAGSLVGGAGGATGAGGAIAITAGASAGAGGTAGAVAIDAGAVAGGTAAGITIGGANADAITCGTGINYGTSTGTDTIVLTLAPAAAAYVEGMFVIFSPGGDNTGACTINVNGLGAKNVKTQTGADPAAADVDATGICMMVYDGTNFVIINPATTCD